jgi:hypothetical protein
MTPTNPEPKNPAASPDDSLPDLEDTPDLRALIRQEIRSDPSAGGAAPGTVMGEVAAAVRDAGARPDLVEIADSLERGLEEGRLVERADGLYVEGEA